MSLLADRDLFFFWSSIYSLGEVVIQNGNLLAFGAPLQLFALGPLISLGGPGHISMAFTRIPFKPQKGTPPILTPST